MQIRTALVIVLTAWGAPGALGQVPQAGAKSCRAGEVLRCVPRTTMTTSTTTRLNCNTKRTNCQASLLARQKPVTDRYCSCSR